MLEPTEALAFAYANSPMGAGLVKPFPFGQLHRDNLHVVQAWQQKFHPEVKKRHPKKRKRK